MQNAKSDADRKIVDTDMRSKGHYISQFEEDGGKYDSDRSMNRQQTKF